MEKIQEIKVSEIKSGDYEQRFDRNDVELEDLACSIQRNGLLQPIGVYKRAKEYHLIYGHRRLAAVKSLGWETVTCSIKESEEELSKEITFAENFYRKNLSPLELACSIAEEYQSGRMTIQQIARCFDKSPDWVRRYVAITQWPEDCLELIHEGIISIAAVSNLALVEDKNYREFLVRQARESGATARTTAAWLQAFRAMQPPEQAVEQPPIEAGQAATPAVPQAPCLACGQIYRTDALSHVPICQSCVNIIRQAGQS